MSKLEELKKELQGLVDKGKIKCVRRGTSLRFVPVLCTAIIMTKYKIMLLG